MFENVDLDDIWFEVNENESDEWGVYSDEAKKYDCGPLDDEAIKKAEEELGFKLPESYIYLMKKHNGGLLAKNYLAIKNTDGFWDLEGIYGIGEKNYSINHQNDNKADFEENLISICSSVSGHSNIYLDYNECGSQGEPRVIAIEDELDNTFVLAKNFEDFISRLCVYDDEEEISKHDTLKFFEPDDTIHKAVKKYVIIYYQMWAYIAVPVMIIVSILILKRVIHTMSLLVFVPVVLLPIALFLILGSLVITGDILKRKYKCWFDVIENITTENGSTTYKLKETERKMEFIVRKKDKLKIGDKLLCISEGYAFKYDRKN
ncbi:MAG: SMI1/KNR4 family protein [Lachnospiraceae bacterium]|nr:SMI1/KNR4 family protein [Lachnospiraceae bacterium]